MEPNLDEMAIAESRLAETDLQAPTVGADPRAPLPSTGGMMDIDLDEEPLVEHASQKDAEEDEEGADASMNVAVQQRVDDASLNASTEARGGSNVEKMSSIPTMEVRTVPSQPADVPVILQTPLLAQSQTTDETLLSGTVTDVGPQTSNVRASTQTAEKETQDEPMAASHPQAPQQIPRLSESRAAAADEDPLSEIAELIQEAQRDQVPGDAAETMLALSTTTVVMTETRVEAVSREISHPESAKDDRVPAPGPAERPVDDGDRLSIPVQSAASVSPRPSSDAQNTRRPGPTPSSLAALSVSPFASGMQGGKELPQAMEQLPIPPAASPIPQSAKLPSPVPNWAQSLNLASAQVGASTSVAPQTATQPPQASAGTTVPTEYADGETDDADGETDPGEDVFHQTGGGNSDAEEEFMNGTIPNPPGRPGDPGFTDYLYRASAKNRGRGSARARGTSSATRGSATRGRAVASGPRRLIVEVVLQKYKRLKFKPTANDDVASMLRAPLGLSAGDPIDPDLAFAPAGQVRTGNPSAAASRSASILPPPPMIDPSLMDSPGGADDAQKQKTDRRHWDYNSDEGEHAGEKSTASVPPKQRRKRIPKPQAAAHAVVGQQTSLPRDVPAPSSTIDQPTQALAASASLAPANGTVAIAAPTTVTATAANEATAALPQASAVSGDLPSTDVQMTEADQMTSDLLPADATTTANAVPPSTTETDQPATSAQTEKEQPAANGTASARAKPRKRPKKAEQELNEALLSLASSSVGDDENGVAAASTQPAEGQEVAQAAPKPKKPRKSKAQKEAEAAAAAEALASAPAPEPEPVVPVLAPRRKLKMEQTWVIPDELPTAVPYPIRYYVSPNDGQPIVSWREPEEPDAHSNRPEGTLDENGGRVNPAGSVDKPEDRRANTACEFCKYSIAKCDGYGDRPCSTCCKAKRPVCLYKPWTVEEQLEYEGDLEAGYKRSQVDETANGRDSRRQKRDPPPAELDMTAQDEATVQSMIMADPAEIQQAQPEKVEVTPVPEAPRVHKARKPKMKSQILAPASSPDPVPDSADGVADMLEVVIELPGDVQQEKEKPKWKRAPKTAKRKKIEEQPAPAVAVEAETAPKPIPSDGTIRRRKMQKQQDWFDHDALAVSVPEPIRYYLDEKDGEPIVSWREPENAGDKSKLPAGTLFANGNMVNAKGYVNAPADRRANHACQACRHTQTKCDGYGDRPCSTCMRSRKPTCCYQPWSEAEQREYQAALTYGTVSRRREVHGDSQRFRKDLPTLDELDLSEKDKAIVQSMLTDYMPGPEVLTQKETQTSAKKATRVSPPDDVEVEIDVEPAQSPVREDEDMPMYDAPWPSLHDAEAINEPLENARDASPVVEEPVPEPASPPVTHRKRKIGHTVDAENKAVQPSKKKKLSGPLQEPIDMDTCFAGLQPVRTLKKQQDWFDPDALPVSVPYSMRYYLMPADGTAVVSSAAPEKPGRKSKRPEGTLYEDGCMVNPSGKVDPPVTRRANHACEMCRFSATKCDGYGDRPCNACIKLHRPVCVYQPWTEADQMQYQRDLETGISSQIATSSRGSRRHVQLPAELLTTKLDQTILRSMLLDEDVHIDLQDEEETPDVPAARSSKRKRVITPEPESMPSRKTKATETMASPETHTGRGQLSKPAADSVRREGASKRKKTKAEQENIDVDTCFAGLTQRRKIKLSHDWFDPDALPVSVPYTMRYYVLPRDGQAVVSSALPEEAGVKSKQPEGTLYENLNRVGPRGSVDAPGTRRAMQPCECCRFSMQKCDGYGERPCTACTRSRKPVCVYEPLTEEEYAQYLHELKHGRPRREKMEPPADLQTTRQDRTVLEAMLDIPDEVSERKSHRQVEEPAKSSRAKSKRAASVISEDALDIIDIAVDEESEPEPPRPSKRKKSKSALVRQMPRRQFDMDVSPQANEGDNQSDTGDIYVGPVPRRYLQMPLDVFYVEDLPVSVPYPIRYYLTEDGQPVVSWRKPEPEGTRSKRLVGTLYDNGNRVNPRQMVDIPFDRRANHACEWCRFNLTKCDGYGDRPCSACCSLGRPVCVFRPWTTDDMRNYLIDINESPNDGRPTDSRRAFSVSKALSDLGTSLRDEVVIQSMLEAGPADTGTAEYREAMARVTKEKAKEKRPKSPSPIPSEESYGFEVEIPVEEPVEESVESPRAPKSKRKRGWLPPQAGADTPWTAEREPVPVAGPSKLPVSSTSSARVSRSSSNVVTGRSSRANNGKAKPTQDESQAFTKAGFQVVPSQAPRQFKVPSGKRRPRTGSGTGSDADQSKQQPDEPIGTARKRRRIVSSTPELNPDASDALYAEMNYPESFERSKQWAHFEEVLGISDSDDNSSEDEEYQYETETEGNVEWVGLKRTAGLRVEVELEPGVGWGDQSENEAEQENAAHGLDFVQAIAHAVVSTGSALQNVGQRAWSAATELASGLVDVDVDDSMVEDLLPSER